MNNIPNAANLIGALATCLALVFSSFGFRANAESLGCCDLPKVTAETQGNDVVVSFPTSAVGNYQLEYTDALISPNWSPLGAPVTGNGTVAHITDGGILAPGAVVAGQRFYRVRNLNFCPTGENVLLVYNQNSTEGIDVKNYYLSHRPGMGTANLLAVSLPDTDGTDATTLLNSLETPIVNWITTNPQKRILYIVLFHGIPRRNTTGPFWSPDYRVSRSLSSAGIRTGTNFFNLVTPVHYTQEAFPGTTALVMRMGMGSVASTKAYIDKIAAMHALMAHPNVIVSAQDAGRGGNTYYLDDGQSPNNGMYYAKMARDALLGLNLDPLPSIIYRDKPDLHLTTANSPRAVLTWGALGGFNPSYATDGSLTVTGDASWYIFFAAENLSGFVSSTQSHYSSWFIPISFGGTNYSRTPIGAITYSQNPTINSLNQAGYFTFWERGHLLSEAIWGSSINRFLIALGDPLITR